MYFARFEGKNKKCSKTEISLVFVPVFVLVSSPADVVLFLPPTCPPSPSTSITLTLPSRNRFTPSCPLVLYQSVSKKGRRCGLAELTVTFHSDAAQNRQRSVRVNLFSRDRADSESESTRTLLSFYGETAVVKERMKNVN